MAEVRIILKAGRDKSARQRHPWIFSGAIARVEGTPEDGAAVAVVAADGRWLGWGSWSSASQIRVRIWSWHEEEPITADLLRQRIERAIGGRHQLADDPDTTAYRLIFSESDGLPGVIVDRYDRFLVMQLSTVGAALRGDLITEILGSTLRPDGIIERSDVEARHKEGLPLAEGVRWGAAPPERFEILENGVRYGIDLRGGQKTGAYVDQRDNRRRVAAYCDGADVLSCFSYTGGFELNAARAGARTIAAIDASPEALRAARENLQRNEITMPVEQITGNVFGELRRFRAEDRRWDVIVLDPPKFAATAGQVDAACRGYKDINLLAMQLLRPGGILATFSCSGAVSADLFQKVVFGASVDAGRDVQILEYLHQGADHPLLLTFPEAAYLKGFICRVW